MIWIHGSKFFFLPSITNGRVPLFLTFINYDPYHYSLLLFYFYAHHFQISIPCSFLALEKCSNAKVFRGKRSLRLSKIKIGAINSPSHEVVINDGWHYKRIKFGLCRIGSDGSWSRLYITFYYPFFGQPRQCYEAWSNFFYANWENVLELRARCMPLKEWNQGENFYARLIN